MITPRMIPALIVKKAINDMWTYYHIERDENNKLSFKEVEDGLEHLKEVLGL